jgi:autotransporter-associated beta strand protein
MSCSASLLRPRCAVALLSLFLLAPASSGQTWVGMGADSSWSTSDNWLGGVPRAGARVVLSSGPYIHSVQDLSTPFMLHELTIDSEGTLLEGSPLRFAAPSGTALLESNISRATVGSAIQFDTATRVVVAEGSLTLSGGLSGAGGMTKLGPGRLNVSSMTNASGDVRVEAGELQVGAADGLRTAGAVEVLPGASIVAHGVVESGAGWTNAGTLDFSRGPTDFRGSLRNLPRSRIVLAPNSVTTFSDLVVHNGLEIFTPASSTTVFRGLARGAGAYTGEGTVRFEGGASPGNSPAMVSFSGDLALGASNNLLSEIAGTIPGTQYDVLNVSGSVSINGTLTVALLDGYFPPIGTSFTIIRVGTTRTGTFIGLPEGATVPSIGGRNFRISYFGGDGNDVSIVAIPEPFVLSGSIVCTGLIALRRRCWCL